MIDKPFTTIKFMVKFIADFIIQNVFYKVVPLENGRHGGLHVVVSTLDSASRGSGLSPGLVTMLCSWARHFTLTVLLSTQEYQQTVREGMLGGYLQWTSISFMWGSNTPSCFMLWKPG